MGALKVPQSSTCLYCSMTKTSNGQVLGFVCNEAVVLFPFSNTRSKLSMFYKGSFFMQPL